MEIQHLNQIQQQDLMVYQELFSLFDKEEKGTMPTHQLNLFIRGLGHCPTNQDLKQYELKLDPQFKGYVQFNQLVLLLVARHKQHNIEEELLDAFQTLHNETGSHSDGNKKNTLSVTGVKKYLMEFGEVFTQVQAEQFLEFLENNQLKEGIQFDFKELAKIMAHHYI